MTASEMPVRPAITLAWRQQLAAFWLIAWPSWLLSVASIILVTSGYAVVHSGPSAGTLRSFSGLLSILTNLVFLVSQAFLVRRMIRKKYHSFQLAVVRKDGSPSTALSVGDTLQVWVMIIWPQVAFVVAIWILVALEGRHFSPATANAISSLSLWARLLVIGPIGIRCAVPANYPTFRIEAFGQRFV